ncbi:MAG: glycosyltransferase family 2 protein [Flavobacteriaceae bacterium]
MSTPLNIDVSIVIVNYKSWHHLKNCLQALISINSTHFTFEVIVVDNCSHDGQLTTFVKDFPEIEFVENTGNNGFSNGCNYGANKAKGSYLFFLNPDTIANEDAIHKLLAFTKRYRNVGIVSCHQKNNDGSYEKTIRLFPNIFTLFGLTRAIYRSFNKKSLQNKYSSKESVIFPDWVSGSVVFMSKEWYQEINGWNEDFWMYFEDVDICKRVKTANGKVALLQDAEIIHNHGGASRINIKTASITKTEVLISKHVYVSNHLKGFQGLVSQILIIVSNIIFKTLLAILGCIFFFIPKLRLNLSIYLKLMRYYANAIIYRKWLSKKSLNY